VRRVVTIYGLFDPVDGALRYVGRTRLRLVTRLRGHLCSPSNEAMAKWVDGLREMGHTPRIEKLDVCRRKDETNSENFWIQEYVHDCDLLNVVQRGT
jgi:hypothetical protein